MSALENEPAISGKDLLEELDRLSMANPSAGLDLGLAGLECFANSADEEFLADLHRLVAVCAHYAQKLEHALIHATEASRLYSQLSNDACVVRCEMIVAVAEAGLGLQVRGIQRIQAAIQLAASAGLPEMEALAWGNLSHLYWLVERYDMARECTLKAVSMTDPVEHRRRAGVMYNNLAELCCRLGEPDEAIKYVLRSKELLEDDNSSAFLANQSETESQIHEHRGELDEARNCLERAIHYARMAGSIRQEITYSERLARVEFRRGDLEAAAHVCKVAKDLTLGLDFPHRLDEICDALALVYESQGRFEEAAAELRTALAYRSQKAKREFDETLRSLENAHKMDIAQREAEILRSKNRELKVSEERYALAAKGSAYGIWDIDLMERSAQFSLRYRQLLGYDDSSDFELQFVIGLLHPDDGLSTIDSIMSSLEGERLNKEVRMLHRSGEYRWYQISGVVVFDVDGRPVRMVGSLGDVHERKLNEQAIIDARDRAEEASRLKSEFLANMSHEIRTPMNGVIGLTDVLLETSLTEQQREHLVTIQHCGKSLLAIINDILDLSKIESGKLEIEQTTINFCDTLEKTTALFRSQACAKGLDLQVDLPTEPVWVMADGVRVSQILSNLLGNAIKFTEQGSVRLSVVYEVVGSEVVVGMIVKDTGVGIPCDRMDAIFDSFVQADGSTTRKFGGTGLGLTISRRLARLMGGEISAASEVGQGSTFSVTLRLPAAAKTAKAVQQESPALERRIKVLLAEDNHVNQMVATRQLQKLGCDVVVVSNGREAVEHALAYTFDLVLMDLQMPVQDGISAAMEIREREEGRRTPIVALTANAFEEHRRATQEAGMDGHVTKPFRVEDLARVIDLHLSVSAA